MSSTAIGKKGEEQAAVALESAGIKIIARNYRSKYGEIDIIAIEPQTKLNTCEGKEHLPNPDMEKIIFVEVKNWSAFGYDDLQYGIDIRKQRKIIKTAKYFLSENRKYSNMTIRFDVIFVKNNSITHLASAFTESV